MRSAIVLAGGRSRRLGRDKGLLSINGTTLIEHVCKRVGVVVDEVMVAVGSSAQQAAYRSLLGGCTTVVDEEVCGGPLIGLQSGLRLVRGDRTAVVGCDMPLVSGDVLNLLFEACAGRSAAIPRWPNGYIEPLHSVYDTDECLNAVRMALKVNRRDMRAMILHLPNVIYVSTQAMRRLDPCLSTFTNVNTRRDLQKVRAMLNQRKVSP